VAVEDVLDVVGQLGDLVEVGREQGEGTDLGSNLN
jgi:hypothetical protein